MSTTTNRAATEALERLKAGNKRYLPSRHNPGDISPDTRRKTCAEGQAPYAVVVTCSDSRVIPENVFSAGIGELFVIRVAGNVIGSHELGSIQYAVEHLGCPLVVILGHDHCGAVGAAMAGGAARFVKSITDEILAAIGEERDDYIACCLNVRRSVGIVREQLDVETVGALCHLEDGSVEFL